MAARLPGRQPADPERILAVVRAETLTDVALAERFHLAVSTIWRLKTRWRREGRIA